MQAGDLADGPLADILRALAAAGATGGVHVQRRDAVPGSPRTTRDAVLFLRDGHLYAATSPGPRPLLGVRLVSAGAVTREALEEALESQAGELAGWRLGELLVHLGYVDAEIVTEFVIEQILDTVAEVSSWPAGSWRFRRGEKTREADDLSLDIEDVLGQVSERLAHWSNLAAWGSKADAVPVRICFDEALESAQMPLARTLLHEVDGQRSLSELAVRCGLTTFEAGQVLALLVESGAVRVRGDSTGEPTDDREPVVEQLVPTATSAPAEPAAPPSGTQSESEPEPESESEPQSESESTSESQSEPQSESQWAPTSGAPAQPGDDDLAALLGGSGDDLGLQLAVLARQAADARYAVEQRRHDEQVARRTGTPAPAEPITLEAVPAEHIEVAPLDPRQPAVAAVADVAPPPELALEPDERGVDAGTDPASDQGVGVDQGDQDDQGDQGDQDDSVIALSAAATPAYQRILLEPLAGEAISEGTEPDPAAEAVDFSVDLPPSAADLDAWAAAVAELPDGQLDSEPDSEPDTDTHHAVDTDSAASGDAPGAAFPSRPVGPPPGMPAPPTLAPIWPAAAAPADREPGVPLAPAALAADGPVEPFGEIPTDEAIEVSAAAHFAELAQTFLATAAPADLAARATERTARPEAEPLVPQDLPAAFLEPGQQAAIRAALSEVALTEFAPAPRAAEPEVRAVPEPAQLWGQQDDFAPSGDSPFADTASLLRELSSLGLDDAPTSAPTARPPAPRTAAGGGGAKPKRKSIFGR